MNLRTVPLKTAAAFLAAVVSAGCAAGRSSLGTGGKAARAGIQMQGVSAGASGAVRAAGEALRADTALPAGEQPPGESSGLFSDGVSLEQIAEIERSGSWFPGLALAGSGLLEKAGDYAGAAIAAYKELAWTYGLGSATLEQVEEGLQNAVKLFEGLPLSGEPGRSAGLAALGGCAAFTRGDWARAGELLSAALPGDGEPDSFLRWMLLVCSLEQQRDGGDIRQARSAYGAIRARYAPFPGYWYHGARAFSAGQDFRGQPDNGDGNTGWDGGIAAAFAEQCINTSPQGPFAQECREILSGYSGLAPGGDGDYSSIRTRAEIENTVRLSVSMNDPGILEGLFPLIGLPDNPYTHYALGAMKALSRIPEYRAFFSEGAGKSSGRLGERLRFLAWGGT